MPTIGPEQGANHEPTAASRQVEVVGGSLWKTGDRAAVMKPTVVRADQYL